MGFKKSCKGKFVFHRGEIEHALSFHKGKVCVVSIIGKSPYDAEDFKAAEVDGMLQKNVFQTFSPTTRNDGTADSDVTMTHIEGYHDVESNVVYLHLVGALDTCHLVKLCRSLESELQAKGFLPTWSGVKFHHAKMLLLLFSVSHLILVVHPVPTFDVSCIHLFRILDGIRQKAQPFLFEILRDCPVTNEWAQAGRPCSPRVLFVFQSSNLESGNSSNNTDTNLLNKKMSPLKKLEHALEDQIYRILRKSRVITNNSMNSLFAIPANQEFVYVRGSDEQVIDSKEFFLQQLQEQCLMSFDETGTLSEKRKCSNASTLSSVEYSGLSEKELDHSFKKFLWQHVELAMTKGFDDNVGRHSGNSLFELPSGTAWFEVASKLYQLFFNEDNEALSKDVLGSLRSQIDVDGRFSEARCSKVFPIAIAAYHEGLPSHYSSDVHHGRMTQAYHMFFLHARGPAFERFAVQLQEECEKFWKNGHQLCEVHSLTGNPCLKPIHRLPNDPPESEDVDGKLSLPVMLHCSQVKLTSACNCGRKQSTRDDPFDFKVANYDFYENLAKGCCTQLYNHEFPVFQPSIVDYKAAKITVGYWNSAVESKPFPTVEKETSVAPGMSLALSLGQFSETSGDASGRLSPHPDPSPHNNNNNSSRSDEELSMPHIEGSDLTTDKDDKVLTRQISTTEYLPGMLHSDSPTGLLPSFSSWSLICLGPSSIYSHNLGIHDQPNFISGTNFLLPWDVAVKTENVNWLPVAESSNRKGIQPKSSPDYIEANVKVFIGMEYECPRGHRFMCSNPDKILKASCIGFVKENATKLVTNDMPLYFPCPCRPGKPVMAQLMRVHVVTPKALVYVTVDPKVQPAPPMTPCPVFFSGNRTPVKLNQSSYWVLRLPFIYQGDQGPFLPPKDKKNPSYGRFLKGAFSVVQ